MSTPYNYNKLADKHVLIFGATSGLGYAAAKASLAASARITISSSSSERITKTIERLVTDFPGTETRIQGFACDLSNNNAEKAIEHLFSQTGRVDHIIFSAADPLPLMPLQEITRDKLIAAGQVRFFAPILVAKVGSHYLTQGPESSFTITGGTIWERPSVNWTALAGYMGGLVSVTRSLALELKPVRVNIVSPGLVDTELWDATFSEEQKQEFFKGMADKQYTGRVARPEEIAEAYVYLMRDSNMTGRIISSDSGAVLV